MAKVMGKAEGMEEEKSQETLQMEIMDCLKRYLKETPSHFNIILQQVCKSLV